MQDKLDQLKQRMAQVMDIRSASAVLSWDTQTYMPKGGNAPAPTSDPR